MHREERERVQLRSRQDAATNAAGTESSAQQAGLPALTQAQQVAALWPPDGAELEQPARCQGAGQPVGLQGWGGRAQEAGGCAGGSLASAYVVVAVGARSWAGLAQEVVLVTVTWWLANHQHGGVWSAPATLRQMQIDEVVFDRQAPQCAASSAQ